MQPRPASSSTDSTTHPRAYCPRRLSKAQRCHSPATQTPQPSLAQRRASAADHKSLSELRISRNPSYQTMPGAPMSNAVCPSGAIVPQSPFNRISIRPGITARHFPAGAIRRLQPPHLYGACARGGSTTNPLASRGCARCLDSGPSCSVSGVLIQRSSVGNRIDSAPHGTHYKNRRSSARGRLTITSLIIAVVARVSLVLLSTIASGRITIGAFAYALPRACIVMLSILMHSAGGGECACSGCGGRLLVDGP